MTHDQRLDAQPHSSFAVQRASILITASLSVLLTCCSSLQVPLKPPDFKPDEMLRLDRSGLSLAVKPIEGVGSYWSLFDDDLPEIGIAAAWVVFKNESGKTIDLSHSVWSVSIGERRFHKVESSRVLSRYYRGRRIKMYTIAADRKARQELARIALHLGRLRPSTEAEGLVFFRIDPALAPQWTRGALLQIGNIRIVGGNWFELSLPLTYASP